MTFAPEQRGPRGAFSPAVRTVLFCALMIALAFVLWQMSSQNDSAPAAPQMSYSDFMSQVEKKNISTVQLYESSSTAEVRGQLREPPSEFRVTIPKETIPDLTERLRKQGVVIQVVGRSEGFQLSDFMMEYGWPLIFFAAICVIAWRRFKRRGTPPAESSSRPIG